MGNNILPSMPGGLQGSAQQPVMPQAASYYPSAKSDIVRPRMLITFKLKPEDKLNRLLLGFLQLKRGSDNEVKEMLTIALSPGVTELQITVGVLHEEAEIHEHVIITISEFEVFYPGFEYRMNGINMLFTLYARDLVDPLNWKRDGLAPHEWLEALLDDFVNRPAPLR